MSDQMSLYIRMSYSTNLVPADNRASSIPFSSYVEVDLALTLRKT